MTLEWIRFTAAAVLIILGLCSFGAAVLGAYRFGFVLNRMHAAGIGDTAGIFFVIASLAVARGLQMDTLKLVVLILLIGAMVIRSIIGPRSTDRIMSVNMLGTMTICSIAVLSVLLDEGYLADVAMIYAMISFVAVLMMASMFVPSKPKAPVLEPDKEQETASLEEAGGER